MSHVTETACAKINLALYVLGRRSDGYHALDSIVGFADFGDRLDLSLAAEDRLVISGPFADQVPGDGSNIILKAVAAMRSAYAGFGTELPGLAIALEKNLPVAAGIGGGSSDAAATLRGILRLMSVAIPDAQLTQIALTLGADVPVCMDQTICRMRGIGEDVAPLAAPPAAAVVLVNPRLALSTRAVFAELGLVPGDLHGDGLMPDQPLAWRNDLLPPARHLLPAIDDVLAAFPSVLTAGMSGSGATCFGLADSLEAAQAAAAEIATRHPTWWVKAGRLR